MCGICGVVFAERARQPGGEMLARMAETLRPRGPDAEGFFVAPGVGFGHRRLKVIDLAGGTQPMTDPTGQLTICFNGEIYNFQELRRELESTGEQFHTTSDTEVLLLGWRRWGQQVLERLLGMFAFAIWDARDRSLWLVRDRLGVKPLYWASLDEGGLAFGSELHAITASGLVAPRLDFGSTARYLALGYVVGSASMLKGMHRLPAGHVLHWQADAAPRVSCYWDLAERWRVRAAAGVSNGAAAEQFSGLLEDCVAKRLVSDVPLGAFLSGGLDSSTVTALMCRHQAQVETFSIGFAERSFDESPYAREVAESLGTRHFNEIVRCDSPELLLAVAGRQDEPFADTSILPTHRLCEFARRRVTVALSGDGGDELLAGYVTHQADRLHERMRVVPTALVRAFRRLAGLLPDNRRKVSFAFKLKQFLAGHELDACDAHASWRMLASPGRLSELLGGVAAADAFEPFREAHAQAAGLNPLDRALYVDYKTWLTDDILFKVDRASMNHGLEVRGPFLDHRLVEFCAGLPPEEKLRGRVGKHLLRRVAAHLTPQSAITRRKAGFNAPVADWLCGPWRELVAEHLSERSLAEFTPLDPRLVGRLVGEHLSGRRDHGYLLFTALMLALWLRRTRPGLG